MKEIVSLRQSAEHPVKQTVGGVGGAVGAGEAGGVGGQAGAVQSVKSDEEVGGDEEANRDPGRTSQGGRPRHNQQIREDMLIC